MRSCIWMFTCVKDRVAGSVFCDKHHKEHKKSPYPAQLRAAMDLHTEGKKR